MFFENGYVFCLFVSFFNDPKNKFILENYSTDLHKISRVDRLWDGADNCERKCAKFQVARLSLSPTMKS